MINLHKAVGWAVLKCVLCFIGLALAVLVVTAALCVLNWLATHIHFDGVGFGFTIR